MSLKSHSLSEQYMITGFVDGEEERFLNNLESAIFSGIKMVQLRLKDVSVDNYNRIAAKVSEICVNHDCTLILNHQLDSLPDICFQGLHITSNALMSCKKIPPNLIDTYSISAPVHNSEEITKAQDVGLDFGILSPIQQSISYPSAKFLGWKKAIVLKDSCSIPLYAAGGMMRSDVNKAEKLQFIGIAAIGSLWGDACIPQDKKEKKGVSENII